MVDKVGSELNFLPERACWIFLLLCANLSQAAAQGRSPFVPLEEMARDAQVIGVGTVQSSTARLEPKTGMISTDFTLSVTEMWKGEALTSVVLIKPGGKIGADALTIPGHEYDLKVGESVVFFAVAHKFGNYSVIGIHDGLYRVGPGADPSLFHVSEYRQGAGKSSPLTLSAFKDRVWRALGRPVEPRAIPPPPIPPSKEGPAPSEPPKQPPKDSAAVNLPTQTPTPASEPAWQSWGGWIVLILLFAVGMGVIISKRKSSVPD